MRLTRLNLRLNHSENTPIDFTLLLKIPLQKISEIAGNLIKTLYEIPRCNRGCLIFAIEHNDF